MKIIIILLLILLLLLGIWDYFINDSNFIQDYIRWSFTETIGIIITVIFIQYFLDKKNEEDLKSKEIEKILRRDILISYYNDNFWDYAKNITFPDIPKEKWSLSLDEIKLEENFDFKRLKSIFMPSLSLFDWSEPAFKMYFGNQEKFIELIKSILLNDDIKYFKEYEELLLDYIKNIEPNNPYKSINNSYIMFQNARNNKQLKDIHDFLDLKIIKEHEWPVVYLNSNIKNYYIRLYQIINYNIKFIKAYKEMMNKINLYGK